MEYPMYNFRKLVKRNRKFFFIMPMVFACSLSNAKSEKICDHKSDGYKKVLLYKLIREPDSAYCEYAGRKQVVEEANKNPILKASIPIVSIPFGKINGGTLISITSLTPEAKFCYTTNGLSPKCNSDSTSCSTGIIGSNVTYSPTSLQLKVVTCAVGKTQSEEVAGFYYSPILFVSNSLYNGNLSKASGDIACNSDSNKPSLAFRPHNAIYKMMRIETGNREVNPLIDWVLSPNQSYYNLLNQIIMTTNSSSFYDLASPLSNPVSTTSTNFWSGTSNANNWVAGSPDCGGWASNIGNGRPGIENAVNSSFLSNGPFSCNNSIRILCAEQ
jgi:hypothetical protein